MASIYNHHGWVHTLHLRRRRDQNNDGLKYNEIGSKEVPSAGKVMAIVFGDVRFYLNLLQRLSKKRVLVQQDNHSFIIAMKINEFTLQMLPHWP